jgi:hypothetical protein
MTASPTPGCVAPAADPTGGGYRARPPSGAIQRIAAELLDVLAEELTEAPAETGLLALLASNAASAADAHQIPWNPWIRDGIETAALLGLGLVSMPALKVPLTRKELAYLFATFTTERQVAWLQQAAYALHLTGDPGAYGPPIGQRTAPQTPRAEHPGTTISFPAVEGH